MNFGTATIKYSDGKIETISNCVLTFVDGFAKLQRSCEEQLLLSPHIVESLQWTPTPD
jgi:hypothetical protein